MYTRGKAGVHMPTPKKMRMDQQLGHRSVNKSQLTQLRKGDKKRNVSGVATAELDGLLQDARRNVPGAAEKLAAALQHTEPAESKGVTDVVYFLYLFIM